MGRKWPATRREREIDAIRATYARYRATGRYRLWDTENPGIARQQEDLLAVLTGLVRDSLPGDRGSILDLGCGEGSLAEMLKPQLPDCTWMGVDVRDDAIAEASARVPDATFAVASADQVPAADSSFDVVLAIVLFSSLPSAAFEDAVAAEIARVLRPGGWLVFYDARIDNPANRSVHGITRPRLNELFRDWHAELRTMTLLPPLARRLGPLTPVAYPVLETVPMLRTHLGGRLQRPPHGGRTRQEALVRWS